MVVTDAADTRVTPNLMAPDGEQSVVVQPFAACRLQDWQSDSLLFFAASSSLLLCEAISFARGKLQSLPTPLGDFARKLYALSPSASGNSPHGHNSNVFPMALAEARAFAKDRVTFTSLAKCILGLLELQLIILSFFAMAAWADSSTRLSSSRGLHAGQRAAIHGNTPFAPLL